MIPRGPPSLPSRLCQANFKYPTFSLVVVVDYIGGGALAHQQWHLTIPRIQGVQWLVLDEVEQIVSHHVHLMEPTN